MKDFKNYNLVDNGNYYTTYYFYKYKDFLIALEKAEQDNKYSEKYTYSVGARTLEDLKDYFYITIF